MNGSGSASASVPPPFAGSVLDRYYQIGSRVTVPVVAWVQVATTTTYSINCTAPVATAQTFSTAAISVGAIQ